MNQYHFIGSTGLVFCRAKNWLRGFNAAGHQVSAEEWAVLLLLWRENGQGPAAIAEQTIRDRTTVTRLLDGMEKKGWIARVPDAQDRRRFQVHLTDDGRSLETLLVPVAQVHIWLRRLKD